jgi:hypothetical protein
MRPLGFSTGALAFGNFRAAIDLVLRSEGLSAVELSALREHELPEIVGALNELDLRRIQHVSVHAPSSFDKKQERGIVDMLLAFPKTWPIIVHPDVICDHAPWLQLGPRLVLENMDVRKRTGTTADEMASCFDLFPEAGFCLDLAHARQIDPSMKEACLMLERFSDRLVQFHVSSLDLAGKHVPVFDEDIARYFNVAKDCSANTGVVIESINPFMERPLSEQSLWLETEAARVSAIFRA